MNRVPRRIDLVGKEFGRLTVLSFSHKDRTRSAVWNCVCSCGKNVKVLSYSLRNGLSKSCGCYHREIMKYQPLNSGNIKKGDTLAWKKPQQAAYTKKENAYKTGAKERNFEYNLTTEQFKQLIHDNCYYCGSEPIDYNPYIKKDKISLKTDGISPSTIDRAWIKINGIDRIDSTKGYSLDNVRTCCTICNRMKLNYTESEFFTQIKKIYATIIPK